MGLMDNLGGLTGVLGGGGQNTALVQQVIGMLTGGEGGGLQGLVQRFNAAGLGNIISSWIGTGQNLPISPEQLTQVLGPERTQQVAAAAGMAPDQAAHQLSQLLPNVVDKLTPNGSIPAQGDMMSQVTSLLGQFLK